MSKRAETGQIMASNMSELEEAEGNVDDDEEVIVPRPHHYSISDCPRIIKVISPSS